MTTESQTTEIRGVILRTFYSSAGFSAGILRTPDNSEVRFSGRLFLRAGEPIRATGEWITHQQYGEQFQIQTVEIDSCLDVNGLAAWLSFHPDAVGIGPVRARKVAENFGAQFDRALADEPEKIAAVAGVPLENIQRLATAWLQRAGYNAVATKLASAGLTKHQIDSLIEACGSTVVQALEEDPYSVLGKAPGFGFKKIDDIARKSYGVPKDSERRIDAGIVYCLKQALDDGSTCLARPDLCGAAEKALFLDGLDAETRICWRIDKLALDDVIAFVRKMPGYYALPWVYKQEAFVAEFLKTGNSPNPCFPNDFRYAGPEMLRLDESQLKAAANALNHRIAVISGGAGTGKTTTINALCQVYKSNGKSVALCAPTGKASRRMAQVTNLPAQTIHRLLEYSPILEDFARGPDNPISQDVVIVDETSMVSIDLAYALFRAIAPRTAVLLVGDHHQLPPVGPGALLRDCIAKNLVPVKILEHCHRQAGTLKKRCSSILQGHVDYEGEPKRDDGAAGPWYVDGRHEEPESALKTLEKLWTTKFPAWGYDSMNSQVITAMHRGVLGTRNVNRMLQRLYQESRGVVVAAEQEEEDEAKPPQLCVADKVICTKNNYSLDIFNGMQGLVRCVRPLVVDFDERGEVEIPSELRNTISLAYALTIHKAQGSEWDCVVTLVGKEAYIMLYRQLIYTAVTRARKTVIVIGNKWAIELAASTTRPVKRQTILSLCQI